MLVYTIQVDKISKLISAWLFKSILHRTGMILVSNWEEIVIHNDSMNNSWSNTKRWWQATCSLVTVKNGMFITVKNDLSTIPLNKVN